MWREFECLHFPFRILFYFSLLSLSDYLRRRTWGRSPAASSSSPSWCGSQAPRCGEIMFQSVERLSGGRRHRDWRRLHIALPPPTPSLHLHYDYDNYQPAGHTLGIFFGNVFDDLLSKDSFVYFVNKNGPITLFHRWIFSSTSKNRQENRGNSVYNLH